MDATQINAVADKVVEALRELGGAGAETWHLLAQEYAAAHVVGLVMSLAVAGILLAVGVYCFVCYYRLGTSDTDLNLDLFVAGCFSTAIALLVGGIGATCNGMAMAAPHYYLLQDLLR